MDVQRETDSILAFLVAVLVGSPSLDIERYLFLCYAVRSVVHVARRHIVGFAQVHLFVMRKA
jgi:hypothetical protein